MKFIEDRLYEIKRSGLYRKLNVFSGEQSVRMRLGEREVLLLASNDYLGLAGHARLKDAAIKAITEYGFGTGASRLVSGTTALHETLENRLADFKKKESAILFNSGYEANCGVISSIVSKGDTVFCDRLNHASIWDGVRLSGASLKRFPHRDINFLEKLLKKSSGKYIRLIVTDGVFSMDGDVAPLREIIALAGKYDALVMVDDAHATGVIGVSGRGTSEYLNLDKDVDIHMGTLSKAVGSIGGYVACSRALKDFLINRSRNFIYTTSLPPAAAAASIEGINLIEESGTLRGKLLDASSDFRYCLNNAGFDTMASGLQIIPVMVGDESTALKAHEMLLDRGFFVPAIRYPTVPKGKARLRLSLSASHNATDLEGALNAVIGTGKELGII